MNLAEKFERFEPETLGYPFDRSECEVALAALDPTHVRPVHAQDVRKRLLRKTAAAPVCAQIASNSALKVALHSADPADSAT
jgi:hypothetical protein